MGVAHVISDVTDVGAIGIIHDVENSILVIDGRAILTLFDSKSRIRFDAGVLEEK